MTLSLLVTRSTTEPRRHLVYLLEWDATKCGI